MLPAPEDAAQPAPVEDRATPVTGARPASRRRPTGPQLSVIRWRDIPAQVTARDGDRTEKWELHRRFQVAIDRAAVKAGLDTYDRYIAEWRTTTRACGAELSAEVQAEVARLDAAHPRALLDALVSCGGVAAGPTIAAPAREPHPT